MSEISLNASMRSNLLSLQQISKLQDRTQLRLSTGLKVNSAIDNPSSYYTATALNNRADDLSALLDSMGQGVQTIKAANEGLEKAEDLISQMKAIAEQVNTSGSYVPEKEYFIKEIGANGAVVSTADELRDAINSGKETVCVYGKIDLGDISTSGGLQLQENQKLVGVNYFGNYKDGEGFSGIRATASVANKNLIDITKTGCLVSDLSLNYENMNTTGSAYGVNVSGGVITDLQNMDIIAKFDENNGGMKAAIASLNKASTNILGKCNIKTSGNFGVGIRTVDADLNVICGTKINIKTEAKSSYGMYIYLNANLNIEANSSLNVSTKGNSAHGIYLLSATLNTAKACVIDVQTTDAQSYGIYLYGAKAHIQPNSQVNIKTKGYYSSGISLYGSSFLDVSGDITIDTLNFRAINTTNNQNNSVRISPTASIYFHTTYPAFYNSKTNGNSSNILSIASGAKLSFEKNGSTKWYQVQKDYKDENTSTTTDNTISADNVETKLNVAQTSSWQTPADIIAEREAEEAAEKAEEEAQEAKEQANRETYQKQFNSALSQYDSLIKDSAYKGINLLQEDKLKVNFNEDKSAHILVQGVDVTSENIGLLKADWQTGKDVSDSLSQVLSVRNKLRTAASQLGNYYSIITERQTFTENLINVLTEGADKLTLADMNEESANMLSLQTQQNLAIKSLSLASQASQAVLKLF